jgi:hypothetical protein
MLNDVFFMCTMFTVKLLAYIAARLNKIIKKRPKAPGPCDGSF